MSEMLMTEAATTTEGNASQGAAGATADQAAAAAAGDQAAAAQAQQQQAAAGDSTNPGTVTGEADKAKGDQGAPVTYELKAPEGAAVSDKVIGAYTEVAKELKLTPEAAQQILDKVAPLMASQQAEAVSAVRGQWLQAAKTDQEFGGEKLTENLALAKKALDQFGSPELTKLLADSGLGNHPELIRVFYRAGKAISEDGFVPGSAPAGGNDPAKRLYPNQA